MSLIDYAKKLRPIIEQSMQSVPDETALEAVSLFPQWKEGETYTTGQRIRYDGVLYSVLQDHTSQEGWTPTEASSLFAKVLIPDTDVIPEWEQPDSTNAYKTGDKVMFEGTVYVSLIDNNVWSPADYPAAWEAVKTE